MNDHKGVNLYAAYQRAAKQKRSGKAKKGLGLLPLLLLLVAVAAVSLVLWQRARARQAQLDELNARIESLSDRYAAVQDASDDASAIEALYNDLVTADAFFRLYPVLMPDLITDVETCADEIFTVTAYGFEETSGTLAVDAYADSVNEVPDFIGRLRATGDFDSVHYTGYSSDEGGTYYCTSACLLPQGELYTMLSEYPVDQPEGTENAADEGEEADELPGQQGENDE